MDICKIQELLGIDQTGEYSPITIAALKNFQVKNNIPATGILNTDTEKALMLLDSPKSNHNLEGITDISHTSDLSELKILQKPLKSSEYYADKQNKVEYIFIHHTAGNDNPYAVVDDWNSDSRGRIGTQFVIGGKNINGSDKYDGTILQCIPDLHWASHLGSYKEHGINLNMHKNSIGIELCNFGQLTQKGSKFYTYTNTEVPSTSVYPLKFRGYDYWHSYSEKQLEALYQLLINLGNKYNIDLSKGLPSMIPKSGIYAFDYNISAVQGNIKGILTHTNVRKDKVDCYPHINLINMLKRFV